MSNALHEQKAHYSKSLKALGTQLHFTAHSHHLWPDITFEAQKQYWIDSAKFSDEKWDYIFSDILPISQSYIAKLIGTKRNSDVFFASNTHDIIIKIFSALKLGVSQKPLKVLASNGEFHSFNRLAQAWSENNLIELTTVDTRVLSFEDDFIHQMATETWDIVFTSHVFFESSKIFQKINQVIKNLPDKTHLIIDGYHSLGAIPCNLSILDHHHNAQRVFYLGGGYKYLQAGEGACFCLSPMNHNLKPYHTGWFASFGELQESREKQKLSYSKGGMAFAGATFDPTSLYRFNASARLIFEEQKGIYAIQKYIKDLQRYFVEKLQSHDSVLSNAKYTEHLEQIGSFISMRFSTPQMTEQVCQKLKSAGVSTDCRGVSLRFGFAVYQSKSDIDELFIRLSSLNSQLD